MSYSNNQFNSPSITRANVHILQSGGGEEALILENDGDGSDLYGFEIGTNDLHILYDSNNDGIGVDLAELDSGSGLWFANSDMRLKTNIQTIENGVLDRVKRLNAVSYQFNHSKENQRQQIGFIAQDVQKLFPELVKESEKGMLRLNYGQFSVLAIKAIQEQQKEMEERDQEIEALKVQVEKLTKLVESQLDK